MSDILIYKGPIGEQDQNKWDGITGTFTRDTSTGGTQTLNKVGYEVDALMVYGGGVNFTAATINSALLAIGTTNKVTLLLRPGSWAIATAQDWSTYTNVTIKCPSGAYFTKSGTGAITFGGPFEAGLYQVFSGFAAGDVTGLRETWIEWFGSAPGAAAAVNSIAIQSAFQAAWDIKAGPGAFTYDTGLAVNRAISFRGSGVGIGWGVDDAITRLHYTGTGVALSLALNNVVSFVSLSDFMLSGTSSSNGGILVGNFVVEESKLTNILIRDFTKTGAYGLRLYQSVSNLFENVVCNVNYYGLLANYISTNNVFKKCRFENSSYRGAYITYLKGTDFYNPVFEASQEAGLYIEALSADAVRNLTFHNPWFEGNNTVHATDDAEMVITGSGGLSAYSVNVYNPHFESPGSSYIIRMGYATFCHIQNPRRWLNDDIIVTSNSISNTILDFSTLSISGQNYTRIRVIPNAVGTFTCANNKDTVVADVNVRAGSLIYLFPTNAAAGTLMGGVKSLYISAKVANTSFTVTTADANPAGGNETFNYEIVQ